MTPTWLNLALLIGSVVVLVGLGAVRISARVGLPSLLFFLFIGLAIGEAGFGVEFSNAELSRNLGLIALVLILAEGGLTTRWSSVRDVIPAAVSLGTIGVGASAVATAVAAKWVLNTDWRAALLVGAVLASTDAAAVFANLRRVPLRRKVAATLELESGLNDALAVLLVLIFADTEIGKHSWYTDIPIVIYELVGGAAIGGAIGWLAVQLLRRSALPFAGLYPLGAVAFTVLSYAVATLASASGFIAVYIAGLVLGNARLPHRTAVLGFSEGLASLAQIGLFVMLGLLVSPSRLDNELLPAIAVGAALLLVARPVSVFVSTVWLRVPWREQAFLSWAGLRGAVPIVLATIPVTSGFVAGSRIFNLVFVLVVIFTLVQGTTLRPVARWLKVTEPLPSSDVDIESAPLSDIDAQLLSLEITGGSRLHGVYVAELRLPAGALLSLVVRAGEPFVPDRLTRLRKGDQLLILTTAKVRRAVQQRLQAVSRSGRLAGWLPESSSNKRT